MGYQQVAGALGGLMLEFDPDGSATVALLQGLLVALTCLVAGFRPAQPALLPALLTQLDPLSYGVDGMRSVLLQQSYFGVMTDAVVLITLAVVLLCVAAWRFNRIEA